MPPDEIVPTPPPMPVEQPPAADPPVTADPPAPTTAAPAPAAPAPIVPQPTIDYDRFAAAIVNGLITANAHLRPPPPEPGIDDVPDAEIDAAIGRGESVAHLVRKAARAETERMRRTLTAEVERLRAEGSAAIGSLAKRTLEGEKYYKKYRGEIDGMVAQLTPEQQANPTILHNVYRHVIGGHTEEIAAEEREQALRQAREQAPPAPTTTANRATRGSELDPAAILPPDVLLAAKNMGGVEHMATAVFGYKSVDDWLRDQWLPKGETQ